MPLFRPPSLGRESDAAQCDLEIEHARVCPHDLVYRALALVASRARRKEVSLEFQAACALPEVISSDGDRLQQILANLVSNAIRFTSCGCVKVVARMASIHGHVRLAIDVIDSGPGIPSEAYEAIFDPSKAAVRPGTQRIGGTELGLPISRRIARRLGGDLIVRSVPNEGCTFTLRVDPGPLDGVRLIQPSQLPPDPCTDALRLLEMLERVEAGLQSRDREAISELAGWAKGKFHSTETGGLRGPVSALSRLPRDAKEHEISGLIDELRSLAEQIVARGSSPEHD